ncbi:HNH endonuclease [Haloprofundus salilacus]|uniref:HNH endonuclease n=1 Tax=Haloprofundus salilacus TaxID=2876190 RepID=UPI001CC9BF95|nr:HNH endonuclease [Haloprofundus salilacus]
MSDVIDHTDKEALKELYYGEGLSVNEIADRSAVTYPTVIHWMDKHGIERRSQGGGKHENTPWRDEPRLRQLHHEEELTVPEIAEELDTTDTTIQTWLRRHDIENQTNDIKRRRRMWADPEELRRLYHDEELSLREVGEVFGVDRDRVRSEMDRHGIPRRSRLVAVRNTYATFRIDDAGYEGWSSRHRGKYEFLRVHRLLAIAKGYDAHKVFSGDYHVHHINGVKWDNRPDNIELLKHSEHTRYHHQKLTGLDRLRVAELYEHGKEASYTIGRQFGVSSNTVLEIHREFFGTPVSTAE